MTELVETSNYTGPDRRKYKRIKQRFIIRFRQADNTWQMVTAQNMSAGGVLFNFDNSVDRVDRDAPLNLKVVFPLIKEPVNCLGKTVRIVRPSGSTFFQIAVKFLDIGEEEKSIINKSADDFYSKKPGKIEP